MELRFCCLVTIKAYLARRNFVLVSLETRAWIGHIVDVQNGETHYVARLALDWIVQLEFV